MIILATKRRTDYQVRHVEDEDHVRIPGGSLVLQIGRPVVPDYAADLVIPSGYEVQDVTLVERSGLVTSTGLYLPNVTTATLTLAAGEEVEATAWGGAGWWPEETFTWSVEGMPDGASVLKIRVYPFYYDAATTNVQFYKNYTFNIQTITSTTTIAKLATDKRTYEQGEIVAAMFWAANTGASQDLVVSAVVRAESSGEAVDGLALRTLRGAESVVFYSGSWDSTGFAPGYYAIEAELRNEEGSILARADKSFGIGIAAGEITTFTVTPSLLDIGEQVTVSLTFANTGTVSLTGTTVVQIQTETGKMV
jgi:hypothetical protein